MSTSVIRNFKTITCFRMSAQELAAVGVRVNSVNPGVVYTEVFDNLGMHVYVFTNLLWLYLSQHENLKWERDSENPERKQPFGPWGYIQNILLILLINNKKRDCAPNFK